MFLALSLQRADMRTLGMDTTDGKTCCGSASLARPTFVRLDPTSITMGTLLSDILCSHSAFNEPAKFPFSELLSDPCSLFMTCIQNFVHACVLGYMNLFSHHVTLVLHHHS